ncbi:hypothetical protein DL98DRAFT_515730 [Cadophora sp. DSE1049]|nr:hypothetical protein DL98DRAFT_515730 [Cadophora sp. DSE1049]
MFKHRRRRSGTETGAQTSDFVCNRSISPRTTDTPNETYDPHIFLSKSSSNEDWHRVQAQYKPENTRNLLCATFARDKLGLDTEMASVVDTAQQKKPGVGLFWRYESPAMKNYIYYMWFWFDFEPSCTVILGRENRGGLLAAYMEFEGCNVVLDRRNDQASKKSTPFKELIRSASWPRKNKSTTLGVSESRGTTADIVPYRKASTFPWTPPQRKKDFAIIPQPTSPRTISEHDSSNRPAVQTALSPLQQPRLALQNRSLDVSLDHTLVSLPIEQDMTAPRQSVGGVEQRVTGYNRHSGNDWVTTSCPKRIHQPTAKPGTERTTAHPQEILDPFTLQSPRNSVSTVVPHLRAIPLDPTRAFRSTPVSGADASIANTPAQPLPLLENIVYPSPQISNANTNSRRNKHLSGWSVSAFLKRHGLYPRNSAAKNYKEGPEELSMNCSLVQKEVEEDWLLIEDMSSALSFATNSEFQSGGTPIPVLPAVTGTLKTIDESPLGSAISLANVSLGTPDVKQQKSTFEKTFVEDSSVNTPSAGPGGSGTKQMSFDSFIDLGASNSQEAGTSALLSDTIEPMGHTLALMPPKTRLNSPLNEADALDNRIVAKNASPAWATTNLQTFGAMSDPVDFMMKPRTYKEGVSVPSATNLHHLDDAYKHLSVVIPEIGETAEPGTYDEHSDDVYGASNSRADQNNDIGSISLPMARFLSESQDSYTHLPEVVGDVPVADTADHSSSRIDNAGNRHQKIKIRSVKRVFPAEPNPTDSNPAPKVDTYWTWDDNSKAYFHTGDTGSTIWYEDSDAESEYESACAEREPIRSDTDQPWAKKAKGTVLREPHSTRGNLSPCVSDERPRVDPGFAVPN